MPLSYIFLKKNPKKKKKKYVGLVTTPYGVVRPPPGRPSRGDQTTSRAQGGGSGPRGSAAPWALGVVQPPPDSRPPGGG
jgi:hypothetical protein